MRRRPSRPRRRRPSRPRSRLPSRPRPRRRRRLPLPSQAPWTVHARAPPGARRARAPPRRPAGPARASTAIAPRSRFGRNRFGRNTRRGTARGRRRRRRRRARRRPGGRAPARRAPWSRRTERTRSSPREEPRGRGGGTRRDLRLPPPPPREASQARRRSSSCGGPGARPRRPCARRSRAARAPRKWAAPSRGAVRPGVVPRGRPQENAQQSAVWCGAFRLSVSSRTLSFSQC